MTLFTGIELALEVGWEFMEDELVIVLNSFTFEGGFI